MENDELAFDPVTSELTAAWYAVGFEHPDAIRTSTRPVAGVSERDAGTGNP